MTSRTLALDNDVVLFKGKTIPFFACTFQEMPRGCRYKVRNLPQDSYQGRFVHFAAVAHTQITAHYVMFCTQQVRV